MVAYTQNQRKEVRDLKDLAGCLSAKPGVKQQTYILQQDVHPEVTGTLCGSGAGTSRTAGNCNETDLAVVYCLQSNTIGRADKNGAQGSGVNEDISFSLTRSDKHGVAYAVNAGQFEPNPVEDNIAAVDCRNFKEIGDLSGTLMAKEPSGYSLNSQNPIRKGFIVRRLTPTECERLMAFPDGYTAIGHDGKIMSDSARYSMLGNSIVVNCLAYIMQNIAEKLR